MSRLPWRQCSPRPRSSDRVVHLAWECQGMSRIVEILKYLKPFHFHVVSLEYIRCQYYTTNEISQYYICF